MGYKSPTLAVLFALLLATSLVSADVSSERLIDEVRALTNALKSRPNFSFIYLAAKYVLKKQDSLLAKYGADVLPNAERKTLLIPDNTAVLRYFNGKLPDTQEEVEQHLDTVLMNVLDGSFTIAELRSGSSFPTVYQDRQLVQIDVGKGWLKRGTGVALGQAGSKRRTWSRADSASATSTTYHFIVANAKFMLDEEEHFQEQLKERLRWLHEQGRPQDFWLVYEPEFLASFPEIANRVNRPAVALVTTDAVWMT
ncbi:unnamed protein product [Closterium sp. Naga37s-1]|nr:unnamed protein product [Closterium sp. Naga37s-1]